MMTFIQATLIFTPLLQNAHAAMLLGKRLRGGTAPGKERGLVKRELTNNLCTTPANLAAQGYVEAADPSPVKIQDSFNVVLTCAEGFTGESPAATACAPTGGDYTPTGCIAGACSGLRDDNSSYTTQGSCEASGICSFTAHNDDEERCRAAGSCSAPLGCSTCSDLSGHGTQEACRGAGGRWTAATWDGNDFTWNSCPEGYESMGGHVKGSGVIRKIKSGMDMKTCSEKCTEKEECVAFEWNPTKKKCQLNKNDVASKAKPGWSRCVKVRQQFRAALQHLPRSQREGVMLFGCNDNECEFRCKAGYVLANPDEDSQTELRATIIDEEVVIPTAISSLCGTECIPASNDDFATYQEESFSRPPAFRNVVTGVCLAGEICNPYATKQSWLCSTGDDPCRNKNGRCNGGTCVNLQSEHGSYDYKCEDCPDNYVGKDCEIERDETQRCEDKESTPAQIGNNEEDTELTQCMEDACGRQPDSLLCRRWKSSTYNTCEKLVGYGYCDSATRPEMIACCSSSCGWCGAACFVNGSLANHCVYVQQESMANDCANGSSRIVNEDECKAVGRSYESLDVTIIGTAPSFILESRPGGCYSSQQGWGFNPTPGGESVGRKLICSVQTLCSEVADGLNSLCIDSKRGICKKEFVNTDTGECQSSQGEATFTILGGGALEDSDATTPVTEHAATPITDGAQ